MIPKSKIRQTTLNVLYAVLSNGGDSQSVDWNLLWNICAETETDRFRKDLCKVLEHVCRSNEDMSRLLEVRAEAVETAMEGDLTSAPLREKLKRYMQNSRKFSAAVAAMRYSIKDKRRDTTEQLALCSSDVINLAIIEAGLREELLPVFADFPAYAPVLEPFAGTVNRRAKLMGQCAALKEPAALRDNKEFAGLARQAQDLQDLRPAAQDLATAILSHLGELDAMLAPLLKNYSMDRLDLLDKCILYLSLYELKFNKLEVAIVVSEATALANEYSGGKSAPFIHGIIAAASSQN